jgi:hypothetical protein
MTPERDRRVLWHTIPRVTLVVGFATLLLLTLRMVLSFSQAAEASALLVAATAAVHFIIDYRGRPNRRFRFSREHKIVYALFAAAAVAVASAELVRLACRWPTNDGWHPSVAGPGDSTYLYFPDEISSMDGDWKGVARARVLNAEDIGLGNPVLPSFSKKGFWGERVGSDEGTYYSTSRIWAGVTLNVPHELTGKILHLQLDVKVTCPRTAVEGMAFGQPVEDRNLAFTHKASLHLGGPGAGRWYKNLFWGGFLVGNILVIVLGFLIPELDTLSQPRRRRRLFRF